FTGLEPAFGAMIELVELRARPDASLPSRAGSANMMFPSIMNLALVVPNVDAELARLRSLGVEAASPVMQVDLPSRGATRIAFLHDPDDNLIELVERKPKRTTDERHSLGRGGPAER